MNLLFMFILYFVVAGIGLVILWSVVDKISTRFCFMPSTEALILSITYFIITYYLVFNIFSSFIIGIAVVSGIAGAIKLFDYFKLNNLEATISNSFSISKIIELHSNGMNGAYDIAKFLKLKDRDDYNSLIPKIIENLKNRNKLPIEITIEQGETV